MKNIFKISTYATLFSLIVLSACRKQESGEFKPGSINDLVIDSTYSNNYLINVNDSVTLNARTLQSKGSDSLTYSWYYYKVQSTVQGAPVIAGSSPSLKLKATMATGDYYLVLEVTDVKTGVKAYKKTTFTVKRLTAEGWLLLTGTAVNGADLNLSIVSSASEVYKDFIRPSVNFPITGRGTKLYVENLKAAALGSVPSQAITISTTTPKVYFLDYNTFEPHHTSDQVFTTAPASPLNDFRKDGIGVASFLWDTEGRLYNSGLGAVSYPSGFNLPLSGTYKASHVLMQPPSFSPSTGVIYDELGKRLMYMKVGQGVMFAFGPAPATAAFDVNNFPDEPVYANWGPANITYMISKDASGSYWINTLTLTKLPDAPYPASARLKMDIPAGASVKDFATSGRIPVVYYINEHKLYVYKMLEQKSTLLYALPADENIVTLKMFRPNSVELYGPNTGFTPNPFTNNRLAIAANGAAGGVFYTFDLTPNGILKTGTYTDRIDGFATIQDMAYKQAQ